MENETKENKKETVTIEDEGEHLSLFASFT